jgi:hypothetical protein
MEFFNKKEDVLDFQLTEYGKRLLQEGNLDPTYYAFFDDDIMYDSTAGGVVESQNETDRRIKYETPALRVQRFTTSAESRVSDFLSQVQNKQLESGGPTLVAENSVAFVNAFQDTPHFGQKFFIGMDPLGTSDIKTQYAPAWRLKCLANEVVSTQNYYTVNLTGSDVGLAKGIVRNIPQLDITIDYKTFFSTTDENLGTTAGNLVEMEQFESDSNVRLYVQENYLVLEVGEDNTIFQKENFDIEVFLSASDGALIRKQFMAPSGLEDLEPGDIMASDTNVEYYMNLLVDAELPGDVLRTLGLNMGALNGSSVNVRLARDLYETDNEDPC